MNQWILTVITILKGYPYSTPRTEDREPKFKLLKSTFELKISYAGCFGPSPTIRLSSLLKCAPQPKIPKNSLKPQILRV